jgi:hypothetical protein
VNGDKMTDAEVKKKYKALQKHYGDSLVNFEHHPRQFAHQVRLYKYIKEMEEAASKPEEQTIIDFT